MEAALASEAFRESYSAGLSCPGLDASHPLPPPHTHTEANSGEGAAGGRGGPWTEGPSGLCPGPAALQAFLCSWGKLRPAVFRLGQRRECDSVDPPRGQGKGDNEGEGTAASQRARPGAE